MISRSRGASTVAVIGAIAAVLSAIAAVIGALAAAGVFDSDGASLPVATAAPATAGGAVATSPPATEADRTLIDLVYLGDDLGCTLTLTVSVGDQTAVPLGNRFTMTKSTAKTARSSGKCMTIESSEWFLPR